MLMQEPTEEMLKEWQDIYNKNKDNIKHKKKGGLEIVKYLKENHSVLQKRIYRHRHKVKEKLQFGGNENE